MGAEEEAAPHVLYDVVRPTTCFVLNALTFSSSGSAATWQQHCGVRDRNKFFLAFDLENMAFDTIDQKLTLI